MNNKKPGTSEVMDKIMFFKQTDDPKRLKGTRTMETENTRLVRAGLRQAGPQWREAAPSLIRLTVLILFSETGFLCVAMAILKVCAAIPVLLAASGMTSSHSADVQAGPGGGEGRQLCVPADLPILDTPGIPF